MAVKIRLTRRGRKKLARYDVVIADARAPRDGRFIEKIGLYNPNTNPATVEIDTEKAFDWIMKGAQPTDSVRAMLSYRGVMYRKHLQLGVIKGAITQEEADKQLQEWLDAKNAAIEGKKEKLAKAKADKKKAALEAETKVKEARAAAIQEKKKVAEEELVAEVKEASAEKDEALEEDVAAVEDAQTEAPAEEVKEEAPADEVKVEKEKKEEPKSEASAEAPAEEEKKED